MPLLPQSIADLVALDGLPRQATADDGTRHVLYWQSPHVRSILAADWPPPLPSDPTPEQSTAAIAARQQAEQQAQQDAAALRQQILTLSQSAVGARVDQLTAGQVRALIAILLHKEGALDKSGVVRAPGEWVK